METLLAEAEQLAKSGVTELTVIAQDTSAYGIDLYGKPMLRELLEKLTEIEGLHWVRVLYAYPNTVTEELVDAMYRNPKICNYIDIPIQHISAHMLRDMNRHGSAEHIREITDYIRRSAPGFILRTTVMLGFPGETEADFDELMHCGTSFRQGGRIHLFRRGRHTCRLHAERSRCGNRRAAT